MAQSALFEGFRVHDLIPPAGRLGIGDEQRRLAQGEDLAQRVRPGAGDQYVGAGVGVGHFAVQILSLIHI